MSFDLRELSASKASNASCCRVYLQIIPALDSSPNGRKNMFRLVACIMGMYLVSCHAAFWMWPLQILAHWNQGLLTNFMRKLYLFNDNTIQVKRHIRQHPAVHRHCRKHGFDWLYEQICWCLGKIIAGDLRLVVSLLYKMTGTWPWTQHVQPCHFNHKAMAGSQMVYGVLEFLMCLISTRLKTVSDVRLPWNRELDSTFKTQLWWNSIDSVTVVIG